MGHSLMAAIFACFFEKSVFEEILRLGLVRALLCLRSGVIHKQMRPGFESRTSHVVFDLVWETSRKCSPGFPLSPALA